MRPRVRGDDVGDAGVGHHGVDDVRDDVDYSIGGFNVCSLDPLPVYCDESLEPW